VLSENHPGPIPTRQQPVCNRSCVARISPLRLLVERRRPLKIGRGSGLTGTRCPQG
jgi:hypothetical protein